MGSRAMKGFTSYLKLNRREVPRGTEGPRNSYVKSPNKLGKKMRKIEKETTGPGKKKNRHNLVQRPVVKKKGSQIFLGGRK